MSATTGESDADLASRAAGGDERAFTLLMRRHKSTVYRLVRRYVGDADEAYDITQEAFASAWGAIARCDPTRPFDAWLRRIALNKCRDWTRRRFVRRLVQPRGSAQAELETVPDPARRQDVAMADRQALSRLDRAIAELPRALKEPLLLTAFEGLSHQEAGAALGLSPKAVEVKVYRARAVLKAALEAMLDPPIVGNSISDATR